MRRKTVLLSWVMILVCAAPAGAQDFTDVQIRAVPVADGLHMLMGRGGNIGVSHGVDGILLIDDQFAPLSEKIRAAVASLDPGEIRFVLNTHWHGDHTGGNENFKMGGALIVAHDNVRARMSIEQLTEGGARSTPASPAAMLPVITFNDEVTFHHNGGEIHAFHVATAHTDGDAVVHFRSLNAIHAGDLFFNGFYPYIDVDSGGSIRGLLAGIERVLALADDQTRIIPGHGPLGGRQDLLVYRDMLETVRDRMQAAIAAGKTADQVVAEGLTADLDAKWGGGFMKPERFLRIVHGDLSGP